MFIQTKKFLPYNKNLRENAKSLRRKMTFAEKKLWFEYLRGHTCRFVRQKVVENYILDFYCQKIKLGIEIDGDTHAGDENEEHDKKRTKALNRYGIKIIRFWNNDIFGNLAGVAEIIGREIKKRKDSNPLNPPLQGGQKCE